MEIIMGLTSSNNACESDSSSASNASFSAHAVLYAFRSSSSSVLRSSSSFSLGGTSEGNDADVKCDDWNVPLTPAD